MTATTDVRKRVEDEAAVVAREAALADVYAAHHPRPVEVSS